MKRLWLSLWAGLWLVGAIYTMSYLLLYDLTAKEWFAIGCVSALLVPLLVIKIIVKSDQEGWINVTLRLGWAVCLGITCWALLHVVISFLGPAAVFKLNYMSWVLFWARRIIFVVGAIFSFLSWKNKWTIIKGVALIWGLMLATIISGHYAYGKMIQRFEIRWTMNGWPLGTAVPPTGSPKSRKNGGFFILGLNEYEGIAHGPGKCYSRFDVSGELFQGLKSGEPIRDLIRKNENIMDASWGKADAIRGDFISQFDLCLKSDQVRIGENVSLDVLPAHMAFCGVSQGASGGFRDVILLHKIIAARRDGNIRRLEDEQLAVATYLGTMVLSHEILNEDARRLVQEERLGSQTRCIQRYDRLRIWGISSLGEPEGDFPFIRSLMRIMSFRSTCEQLSCLDRWSHWIREIPKWKTQRFAWKESESLQCPDTNYYLNREISKQYFESLLTLSQWRMLWLTDQVLAYFLSTGILPDSLGVSDFDVPIDPFDEQPLRYKREGDKRFVVYSVGPDCKDGGGRNLYVAGKVSMENLRDIGYRINLE